MAWHAFFAKLTIASEQARNFMINLANEKNMIYEPGDEK